MSNLFYMNTSFSAFFLLCDVVRAPLKMTVACLSCQHCQSYRIKSMHLTPNEADQFLKNGAWIFSPNEYLLLFSEKI